MPPTLFLVRHAEGHHNLNDATDIRDATLTLRGKLQCQTLLTTFPHHRINLILSSPLRRTIQTAVLSFAPLLARAEVPFLVLPQAQEVSSLQCDIGHELDELKELLTDDLPGDFSHERINFEEMVGGWNSKSGYWASEPDAVRKRAADLRNWLFGRMEETILLVTHGAFLHYLTEDWTGDDPTRGTAYLNCEVREFRFTNSSTLEDAHIEETEESRRTRGAS